MRIEGMWLPGDGGRLLPVFRGEVRTGDGTWKEFPFLVDTGAERTVFSAGTLGLLRLTPIDCPDRLSGVGGSAESVVVETVIRFERDEGEPATFVGQYAGVTDDEALDMSLLGRDIMRWFALIVDRPGDTVCLLRPPHTYAIGTP